MTGPATESCWHWISSLGYDHVFYPSKKSKKKKKKCNIRWNLKSNLKWNIIYFFPTSGGIKKISKSCSGWEGETCPLWIFTGSIRRWERVHGFVSQAQRGEQVAVYFDAGFFPPAGRSLIGQEPRFTCQSEASPSFIFTGSILVNGHSEHPRQKYGHVYEILTCIWWILHQY